MSFLLWYFALGALGMCLLYARRTDLLEDLLHAESVRPGFGLVIFTLGALFGPTALLAVLYDEAVRLFERLKYASGDEPKKDES